MKLLSLYNVLTFLLLVILFPTTCGFICVSNTQQTTVGNFRSRSSSSETTSYPNRNLFSCTELYSNNNKINTMYDKEDIDTQRRYLLSFPILMAFSAMAVSNNNNVYTIPSSKQLTNTILSTTSSSSSSSSISNNNDLKKSVILDNEQINDTTSIQKIDSLEEAIKIIESSCDRRYLSAVVSSNYKFMYRGVSSEEVKDGCCTIRKEGYDLLDISTYESKDAVDYFINLEEHTLKDRPIKPSNGHLAITNPIKASKWGGDAISVWPLKIQSNSNNSKNNEIHYAWLEEGGEFWLPSYATNNKQNIIVDGIDCGRMSLEDALEGKNVEIMFSADTFLAIPSSFDKELISKLKTSFIV